MWSNAHVSVCEMLSWKLLVSWCELRLEPWHERLGVIQAIYARREVTISTAWSSHMSPPYAASQDNAAGLPYQASVPSHSERHTFNVPCIDHIRDVCFLCWRAMQFANSHPIPAAVSLTRRQVLFFRSNTFSKFWKEKQLQCSTQCNFSPRSARKDCAQETNKSTTPTPKEDPFYLQRACWGPKISAFTEQPACVIVCKWVHQKLLSCSLHKHEWEGRWNGKIQS